MGVFEPITHDTKEFTSVSGTTFEPAKFEPIQTTQKEKIFSGGTFSDILDVLQTPQFAATGLISGKGIKKGVSERLTPSKEFGLGTWSGLIADIVLDPLNLVGAGAITKAGKSATKLGKGATTLGAQVAKGERELLTIAGQSILPKSTEKFLAKGITEGTEAVKRTYAGSIFKKLGATEATGAKALEGVGGIEDIATQMKNVKRSGITSKGIEKAFLGEGVNTARKIDTTINKLIKAKTITKSSVPKLLGGIRKVAIGGKAKLPRELKKLADEVGQIAKETQALRKAEGLQSIEGKLLPLVPSAESKGFLKKLKSSGQLRREFGGASKSDIAGKHFKLGDSIVQQEGKIATEILPKGKKGKSFLQIGKQFFEVKKPLSKEANQLISNSLNEISSMKNPKISDLITTITKNRRFIDTTSFDEVMGVLKNSAKKTAVDEISLNKVLAKAGSKLRFSENPAELVGELIARTGKSKAKKKFVAEVSPVGVKIPKGGVPDGWSESTLKDLKGMMFPTPVTNLIDTTTSAFSKVDDVNDFVKMYDKVQNGWKGLATFVNPAFHSRNFVSNLWQGFLGGVNDSRWYVRSGAIQKAVAKSNKTGKSLKSIVGDKKAKVWKEFAEQGLPNTGWFGADIEQAILKNQNIALRAGGAVGGAVEDNAKFAMFLQRRAQGFIPAEAAADVRKFFFDYNDLTAFEKNVMKRVFPFYTWSRKNMPLQAAMLIQHPTKFSSIAKIKTAIESSMKGEPLDEDTLPGWLKDGYPIFFGNNKNNLSRYFRLEGFLPAVDLDNVADPLQTGLNLVSPLIKSPFELASNRDFFLDREITEFTGQKKEVLGFNISPTSAYFIKQVRPIMELDKLFDEKLTVGERAAKGLFGFKLQNLDKKKSLNIKKYLQTRQEGKIKSEIDRQRKAGNLSVIPGLRLELKNTQRNFQMP